MKCYFFLNGAGMKEFKPLEAIPVLRSSKAEEHEEEEEKEELRWVLMLLFFQFWVLQENKTYLDFPVLQQGTPD